ncbi:MAG: DinB family protein [Dehalococcoidia bacterium]|nr:MAG: DinB family protein [Dehalococcoidia bacterium]
MTDREEARSLLEAAHKELLAAIDGLTPEQMAIPVFDNWSVKDILAHIVSWEEYTLLDLQRLARGHMPALASFKQEDLHNWNALVMSLRRDFPLDQVMHELEANREATIAALDALPDERLAQGQFARIWASITAGHDHEHAEHIRNWRQKEGI